MSTRRPVPFETTLHVRDRCLCLAAQSAARSLARRFDVALRTVGLTNGQFSLLMSLNRPKPAPVGAVAAVLAMDRTTLTANVKPLARRGLVRIAPDPEDGRGRLLSLTSEGEALLARAVPIWFEAHAKAEALLAGADAGALREGLRALARTPDPEGRG